MNNIKRKRIIIPVTILIFIGLAVSFMPLWSDIDIVLHGIQARIGDEEYREEKTINIKGRYWRYLFKSDRKV
jgi:cytochrome c-type biogenesis protein CcmE